MKNGKLLPLCVKCGEADTNKIGKCKRFKNGYRSQCKACDKEYYETNKEAKLLKAKEYRDTKLDKEKTKVYSKSYRESNSSKLKDKKKKYYLKTVAEHVARATKYKIAKINQSPKLSAIEDKQVKMLYKIARHITQATGIIMHVDHIIPISKGGLHHPLNLQVITVEENLSKSNIIPNEMHVNLIDLHNKFYGEIRYEQYTKYNTETF